MLIQGTGQAAMNQVNLVRLTTARTTGQAARETQENKSEERNDCARAKAEHRVSELENQLEAAETREDSFFSGAIPGFLVGGSAYLGTALSFAFSPLPGVPLVAILQALPGAAASGALMGSVYGGYTAAVGEVLAAGADRARLEAGKRAGDSELGSFLAGQEIRSAEDVVAQIRKEISSIRKAVFKAVDDKRKLRNLISENVAGRGANAQILAPSGGLERAAAASLELSLAEELAQGRELRSANGEEAHKAVEAQQLRAKATAIEKKNITARAWIGLGLKVIELAATCLTAGVGSVAGTLTKAVGAGVNLYGKATYQNEDALRLARAADELDLAVKLAKHRGGDARTRRDSLAASRERSIQVLEESQRVFEQGGKDMPGGQLMSLSSIQKVRALASIEDERSAREDEGAARAEAFEHAEAGIAARRRADDEAIDRENRAVAMAAVQFGLAFVNLGVALGQAQGIVSEANAELWEEGHDAIDRGANVLDAAGNARNTYKERRALRAAEEQGLLEKRAEQRAEDADDAQEEARERAKRALDAAITMQRNLAPVLV
jgi:hypothetical protein